MHIQRAIIKNTKSLAHLDIDLRLTAFPSPKDPKPPRVTVLFAANGQGKTTVLESLSLLGHITCMSQIQFRRGQKASWSSNDCMSSALSLAVSEKDKKKGSARPELVSDLANSLPGILKQLETCSLAELLSSSTVAWPLAISGFYLEVSLALQGAQKTTEVLILTPADKSLSTLLSADFTNCIDFQTYATVVYLHEARIEVSALLTQLLSGRSFDLSASGRQRPSNSRISENPTAPFVSYINTDLSDYGRGNDLRESPKALQDHFVEQMVNRIAIPLEENGQFRYFQDLKNAIASALHAPVHEVAHDALVPLNFELMQLAVKNHRLNIEIRRGSRRVSHGITHISAGENEVLFVFLLTLAFRDRPGILLLDEPDLHLATLTKRSFFDTLFTIADLSNHQLIVATHSDAAIYSLHRRGWRLRDVVRLLYTFAPDPNSPLDNHQTVAQYDPKFVSSLLRHRRRNALLRVLRLASSVWLDGLRAARLSWKSLLSEVAVFLTIVTAISALSVPLVSLALDSQLKSEIEELSRSCGKPDSAQCVSQRGAALAAHEARTRVLPSTNVALLSATGSSVLLVAGSVWFKRRRRKKFQAAFREALRRSDA